MVRTAQNKIFIFREGEKVQIEAYGEHIIRVRASKGEIENLNWTLLPPKEDRASVSEEGDNVVLENGESVLLSVAMERFLLRIRRVKYYLKNSGEMRGI